MPVEGMNGPESAIDTKKLAADRYLVDRPPNSTHSLSEASERANRAREAVRDRPD